MKKFTEIYVVLGITLSMQSAIAAPFKTEVVQTNSSETSNQMVELLKTWGFKTTECQGNIIKIQHDVGGEIGCAIPNETIEAGNYIYNSAENTISPLTNQQSNQSENNRNLSAAETKEQIVKAQKFNFEFNNAYDYSACLDIILLAHEGRTNELENVSQNKCATNVLNTFGTNISKEAALELVKSANVHATEVLANALYPVFGIRRRVAINLGYVYTIDKNNSDLLKLIDS